MYTPSHKQDVTMSISNRSLTGLNSEFSFFYTSWYIKLKGLVCPSIYQQLERK